MSRDTVINPARVKLVRVVLLLVVIIAVVIAIYVDSTTEYYWVYPLNTMRDVFTLTKFETILYIKRVVSDEKTLSWILGFPASIRVNSTGDYAIVLARGPSLYTLLVSTLSLALYVIVERKIKYIAIHSKLGVGILVVLALLYALPVATLIPVISTGHNYGFTVDESIYSTSFSELKYTVLNETTGDLPIPPEMRILYTLEDSNISGLTLVAFKVEPRDEQVPIVIFIANSSTSRTVDIAYSRSLYVINGSVKILVFSSIPLQNTTLYYYKAIFSEKQQISILLYYLPATMFIASVVLTLLVYKWGVSALRRIYTSVERKK